MHITTLLKTTHKSMALSGLALVVLASGSALASRAGELLVSPSADYAHEKNNVELAIVGGGDSEVLARFDRSSRNGSDNTVSSNGQTDSQPVPLAQTSEPTKNAVNTSKPAPAPVNSVGVTLSDGILTSLTFVNKVRATAGKSALKIDSELNNYALNHAKNLASQCKLYHQKISLMLGKKDATGKKITAIAENVAYSSSSIDQALNVLKNSPGHYANMIGPYTRVGLAVVKSGAAACMGHVYTVQVFIDS